MPLATVNEFASYLQRPLDTATANLLLLDLAIGLVTDRIGDQEATGWPTVAKSTALEAAARPMRNPDSVKRKTVDGVTDEYPDAESYGVYLSQAEKDDLDAWKNGEDPSYAARSPRGLFPAHTTWPDPAELNQ